MEVKVGFDREKFEAWFDENCEIECEICPLEGYMCDTLLSAAYTEYCLQVCNDDKNNK